MGKTSKSQKLLMRGDLWWTLVGKTSKGRNLIKAGIDGPLWARHSKAKKIINKKTTFGGPLRVRHPTIENLIKATYGGPLQLRHLEAENSSALQ